MSAAESHEPVVEAVREEERGRTVGAVVRDAWDQALVAVNAAEEEVQRFLGRVGGLVELGPEEARRLATELTEKLRRERDELEDRVEQGVRRTISALRLPTREDVQRLDQRIDRLEQQIDRLLERRG